MAHGSPRKEVCETCNTYRKTPRFDISVCNVCGDTTEQIDDVDLKRKLGIMLLDDIPISFEWCEIKSK